MNDLSTYKAALQCKLDIEAMAKRTSQELRAISGGGLLGLTPDHVKKTSKWKAAVFCFNYWHHKQRKFNAEFLRLYGVEYRNDMRKAKGRNQ